MTDTRKEFERAVSNLGWAFDYIGDGQYGSHTIQFASKLWQACQQLNDKRIADLLAVIELQRDALQIAIEYQEEACQYFHDAMAGYEEHKHERYRDDLKETKQALAITPESVELVEVMSNTNGSLKWTVDDWPQSCKLYTIKTKEPK